METGQSKKNCRIGENGKRIENIMTQADYFEVLKKFIDENEDNPGLLKFIGKKISDGSLAESLKKKAV